VRDFASPIFYYELVFEVRLFFGHFLFLELNTEETGKFISFIFNPLRRWM